jgi:hypothetical protein
LRLAHLTAPLRSVNAWWIEPALCPALRIPPRARSNCSGSSLSARRPPSVGASHEA